VNSILEEQIKGVQKGLDVPNINLYKYQSNVLSDIELDIKFQEIVSVVVTNTQNNPTKINYNVKEDFEWYTSGEANDEIEQYKGQYIAIWKKTIVANASSATEVKKIAKIICGENVRPAIVYVPEDVESIL